MHVEDEDLEGDVGPRPLLLRERDGAPKGRDRARELEVHHARARRAPLLPLHGARPTSRGSGRGRDGHFELGLERRDGDEDRVLVVLDDAPGRGDAELEVDRQHRQVGIVLVERAVVRTRGRGELDVASGRRDAGLEDVLGPRGEHKDARCCVLGGGCGGSFIAVAVDRVDQEGLDGDHYDVGLRYQATVPPYQTRGGEILVQGGCYSVFFRLQNELRDIPRP